MNSRALKKYNLPKYKMIELKAFVYQYNDWIAGLEEISELPAVENDGMPHGTTISDPVANQAEAREAFKVKIDMVDRCINLCSGDQNMRAAVRKAVTTPGGLTFPWLKSHGYIYFERDAYYLAVHKFYYMLDRYKL